MPDPLSLDQGLGARPFTDKLLAGGTKVRIELRETICFFVCDEAGDSAPVAGVYFDAPEGFDESRCE
ncbi:MAG: hypothetical protein ABSC48_08990 [Terracidiphilus sp.]